LKTSRIVFKFFYIHTYIAENQYGAKKWDMKTNFQNFFGKSALFENGHFSKKVSIFISHHQQKARNVLKTNRNRPVLYPHRWGKIAQRSENQEEKNSTKCPFFCSKCPFFTFHFAICLVSIV
jgi:hypothetical protein